MVMEYGDIDLARLLARHEAAQRERGALEPDENFIRLYWQQMLQARAPAIKSSALWDQKSCCNSLMHVHHCV